MNFGLKPSDVAYIIETIEHFSEIEKAVIFGSRAMGNYRPGSDIDIAIYGDRITFDTVAALHYRLEEMGPMPYLIDVVDYTHLQHEELKEHIDRVGKLIFNRRTI